MLTLATARVVAQVGLALCLCIPAWPRQPDNFKVSLNGLEITIDRESGVDSNLCEAVSRYVENRIEELPPPVPLFQLEVASAGLARPLLRPEHFARFRGREINVITTLRIKNRVEFTGPISHADGTAVRMIPLVARRLLESVTPGDRILLETLRAYAKAEMSMRDAADALDVHPNTVTYRLEKLSRLLGRDVSRFSDLVEVLNWWRLLDTHRSL